MFALREALARADQMAAVGHMAASVAHQVGTPLNLISGYVQMIREDAGVDSRVTRRLEIVQEQIAKVTSIVRTMLDHARRPTPEGTDRRRRPAASACATWRGPKLDAQGVRLDLSVAAVPAVMADAVQLELALLNLVTNSLDAMPSGGVMSISVGADRRRAARESRWPTRGPGIAPELLPRIFDPWVTTKEAGRGTGLGLSITREVVVGHGGTITVKSEVGVGSVFTIDLPAAPPGRARRRRIPGGSGSETDACRDILIVDDDRETCRFMADLLERAGPRDRVGLRPANRAGAGPRPHVRPGDLRHQPERRAVRASTSCARSAESNPRGARRC